MSRVVPSTPDRGGPTFDLVTRAEPWTIARERSPDTGPRRERREEVEGGLSH